MRGTVKMRALLATAAVVAIALPFSSASAEHCNPVSFVSGNNRAVAVHSTGAVADLGEAGCATSDHRDTDYITPHASVASVRWIGENKPVSATVEWPNAKDFKCTVEIVDPDGPDKPQQPYRRCAENKGPPGVYAECKDGVCNLTFEKFNNLGKIMYQSGVISAKAETASTDGPDAKITICEGDEEGEPTGVCYTRVYRTIN